MRRAFCLCIVCVECSVWCAVLCCVCNVCAKFFLRVCMCFVFCGVWSVVCSVWSVRGVVSPEHALLAYVLCALCCVFCGVDV